MKDLALDLWHDLRHRRLLPVAIALAIALIAVPVLLLKGEPEAAQPPMGKQESNATMPVVNEDGSSLAGSSKLGIFDRKNPFRSLASLAESMEPSPGGGTTGPDAGLPGGAGDDLGLEGDAGAAAGDDPLAAGGGSGGGSAGSDPAAAGGSSGGGGGGSAEPPSDSGGGSASPTPPQADPQFFEYVAEVEFGRVGNEKPYRDVRVLDSLPSERNPVVVYLGQTRSNESAFLVNQAIGQRGEGNCVPNRSSCNIVYLRPEQAQDDHYFETGPPPDYHLKLIAVRRKLDTGEPSASSRSTSAEARTRVEGASSTRKVRRTAFDFRIPLIAGQRR